MKFKLIAVERNDAASDDGHPKGVNVLTFVASDTAVAGEFKTVADESKRVVSETNLIACPDAVKDVCLSLGTSPGCTLVMDNVSDVDADGYTVGSEYDLS